MSVEMPPRAFDPVSVSSMMDPHNQQQQQQQGFGAGGYAYYAATPQYNYSAHNNVSYNMNNQMYQGFGMNTGMNTNNGGNNMMNNNNNGMGMSMGIGSMGGLGAPMTNPMMSDLMQQQQQQQPMQPAYEAIEPHDNDVLMGRGGKNNQHTGNERLRDMARSIRDRYKASAKKGKSNMSRELVQKVRELTPPGRFLKRNPVTNEWEDVGDEIAREKVSQVLRDAVSEWTGPKAAAAAAKKEDEEKQRAQAIALAKLEEEEEKAEAEAKKKNKKSSTMLGNLPPPPAEPTKEKPKAPSPVPPAPAPAPIPMAAPAPAPVPVPVAKVAPAPVPSPIVQAPPTSSAPLVPPISQITTTTTSSSARASPVPPITQISAPPKSASSSLDPDIHDDLDDLPDGPEMDGSFPAMPDDSLNDHGANGLGGRDRFFSDMSFNDTAIDGTPEQQQSKPAVAKRGRLDTDDTDDDLGHHTDDDDDDDDDSKGTAPADNSNATANNNKRRPSLRVPVGAVPWNRNKRKTGLLDRYSNTNMGVSSSDMSIASIGSQLSSRSLMGSQLSSRQLLSSGTRQMSSRQLSQRQLSQRQLSSRQLSSRQLSSRQLSSRQLSSRQLSGRHLMSVEQRKSKFAMMGESDLSLDALSISGDNPSGTASRSPSRKNIFMEQYMAMDMGLSDFSLGSTTMAADPMDGFAHAQPQRPSVIIEGGIDEELSEHGGSSHHMMRISKHGGGGSRHQSMELYNATGVGTSISNMTINTIGTFSGHSRRGLFAGTGNSMRMESGHSFMTMDDLQLEMLDDELFDEFASDEVDAFGTVEEGADESANDEFGDEFATEFC